MNKIDVHLENCYGIKKLEYEFDFSPIKSNTWLIYAPNGVMKTSFAKTFKNLHAKEKPCDQIYPEKESKYDVLVDGKAQINKESICVIEPYNESAFKSEDKILTLLSDKETREEYLKIYKNLEAIKQPIFKHLKSITKSSDCEKEIIETFQSDKKESVYEILERILANIKSSKDVFTFSYHDIFDKKNNVDKFIKDNYSLLSDYMKQYNDLLSKSDFFSNKSENVFGTNEATSLSESLSSDAYFYAGHKLSLKEKGDVQSGEDLQKIIDDEVSAIFNSPELKSLFDEIDKQLRKNAELKQFKKAIEADSSILVRLADYGKFRKDVWLSYLKQQETNIEELVNLFVKNKPALENIIEKAKNSGELFKDVVAEFKRRFTVPFTINIKNMDDAILNESTPVVELLYEGKKIEKEKERDFLLKEVLSQGERRALYLLNVIFDIESRKRTKQETLFIIDDIADSFDYKNKYAIVEYLNDIKYEGFFKSIILTHNFDLFRTIQGRILGNSNKRERSLIAEKNTDGINLYGAGNKDITDPFKHWKETMSSDISSLIPAIPFVRNLIEFKGDARSKEYLTLTHILHQKKKDVDNDIEATEDITIKEVESIFRGVINVGEFNHSGIKDDDKIYDIIMNEAKEIRDKDITAVNLGEKIILSIAIRLLAEKYMWSKVSNKTAIHGCQTGKLYERFKKDFDKKSDYKNKIKILGRVNIMTPESIHLNSFMYEPILDMGSDNLKDLYSEVLTLLGAVNE